MQTTRIARTIMYTTDSDTAIAPLSHRSESSPVKSTNNKRTVTPISAAPKLPPTTFHGCVSGTLGAPKYKTAEAPHDVSTNCACVIGQFHDISAGASIARADTAAIAAHAPRNALRKFAGGSTASAVHTEGRDHWHLAVLIGALSYRRRGASARRSP